MLLQRCPILHFVAAKKNMPQEFLQMGENPSMYLTLAAPGLRLILPNTKLLNRQEFEDAIASH